MASETEKPWGGEMTEEEKRDAILMHEWRHGISWPGLTPCLPPPPEKRCDCKFGEMIKRGLSMPRRQEVI
jgi:hypothetical protein